MPLPGMPGMDPGGGPPPPGGQPPGGPPALPKAMTGAPPTGPGGSPALSPGDGAGRKMASVNKIKNGVLPILHMSMMSFEPGSKEYQAIMRALSALSPMFGRAGGENMLPATINAMAQDAATGKPMAAGPPPGGMPPPGKPPPSLGPAGPELGGGEV